MEKIPTIFNKDPNNLGRVIDEINPECFWVFKPWGRTTVKHDGTCVKIENGCMFKRREVREGQVAPSDFQLVEIDPVTNKQYGWVPVTNTPDNKYHLEAFDEAKYMAFPDGTYELVGPKIQGNPENYDRHTLIKHGSVEIDRGEFEYTFEGIKAWLFDHDVEGLVFYYFDQRGKIKKRDFGMKR